MFIIYCTLFTFKNVTAQDNAVIKGIVVDEKNQPIDMVNISLLNYSIGTSSNRNGEYILQIPANKRVTLVYSFIGYITVVDTVNLNKHEVRVKNITLTKSNNKIGEVIITQQRKRGDNATKIDPKILESVVGSSSGAVETLLKSLPGVSSNNELSSQYSVRGGNFDENLIYVNDIEIYRPFLIRSGQQEGMSFINSDLVSSINFYAGGFNAMYGDKMSSALDIKYRNPSEFRGSASASLLGAKAHFEDILLKGKISHISGIRYKTNRYLLGSLDEKGEYNPDFFDFQTNINYRYSEKLLFSFLGNIATNSYQFIPKTRKTSFGTWNIPLGANIYFDGQEVDKFNTYLGAFTIDYNPSSELKLKFILSGFKTTEQENYDITGQYFLNQLERNIGSDNLGDSIYNFGVGTFINHARNKLDANVFNISHKGSYNLKKHLIRWGIKYQREEFDNTISEWIFRDSAGYTLPYSDEDIELYYRAKGKLNIQSNRVSGYIQDTYRTSYSNTDLYLTGGLRFNYWDFNNQLLVSPRLNLNIYPDWKENISFSIAAGIYQQSPFFKELIDREGKVNYNIKAQKSYQLVAGLNYIFTAWDRPFKLTTETYYKYFDRLIPYQVDNVKINYLSQQIAKGYATGIDMKINGEFVSGVQSWASLSLMNTREDIIDDGHGYIPRPTDQWLNFSLFFQDYLPGNPSYKMQLSAFYGARLPVGPPLSERFMDTFRMPPYRRIDLGFSKVIFNKNSTVKYKFFNHLTDMWVSLEVFNLLNIDNTISYFWVTSNSGDEFAVPNYLTSRKFNLKLSVKF